METNKDEEKTMLKSVEEFINKRRKEGVSCVEIISECLEQQCPKNSLPTVVIRTILKTHDIGTDDFDQILKKAVLKGRVDIVRHLIDDHFSKAIMVDTENLCLVVVAVLSEDVDTLELICSSGNFRSSIDSSALVLAAQDNNTEMVRILLKQDNIDPSFDRNLPLKHAIKNDNEEMQEMIWKAIKEDIDNVKEPLEEYPRFVITI